jgi:hypothetical protein
MEIGPICSGVVLDKVAKGNCLIASHVFDLDVDKEAGRGCSDANQVASQDFQSPAQGLMLASAVDWEMLVRTNGED